MTDNPQQSNKSQTCSPIPRRPRVTLTGDEADRALLKQTRRKFLTSATGSVGSFALASLLGGRRDGGSGCTDSALCFTASLRRTG